MSLIDLIKTEMSKAWLAVADLLTPAEFIKITRSSFDPATGTVSQTSTITRILVGLVDYTDGTRPGSDVEAGDRRAIVRASDLPSVPAPGDLLAIGAETWTVVRTGGDPRLFHDLQIRR
jgi:hypothetical protein